LLFYSVSIARTSDIEYSLTAGTAVVDSLNSYAIVIASLKLPAGVTVRAGM